jgi:hypothetical protein
MIAVFADVSKAFDSLDHETCTYFLHKAGYTPQALRWMRSWQEGRSYRVRCGVEESEEVEWDRGSAQGSLITPLVWSKLPR